MSIKKIFVVRCFCCCCFLMWNSVVLQQSYCTVLGFSEHADTILNWTVPGKDNSFLKTHITDSVPPFSTIVVHRKQDCVSVLKILTVFKLVTVKTNGASAPGTMLSKRTSCFLLPAHVCVLICFWCVPQGWVGGGGSKSIPCLVVFSNWRMNIFQNICFVEFDWQIKYWC